MSMCDTLPCCAPHPARQHDVLTLMQGVTALLRCVTGEGTQGEAAELEAALPVAERRAGGLLPQKSTLERQVLMEREVVYLQMGTHVSKAISWKMGYSRVRAHLPFPVAAEVCIRRGLGTEQRDQGRGVPSSLRADDEHSPF